MRADEANERTNAAGGLGAWLGFGGGGRKKGREGQGKCLEKLVGAGGGFPNDRVGHGVGGGWMNGIDEALRSLVIVCGSGRGSMMRRWSMKL